MNSGKYGINEISQNYDIHRHTVRRIIENEEKRICFVSASEKRKNICNERNSTYENTEQRIYNAVACNNSFTQKEIKEIV